MQGKWRLRGPAAVRGSGKMGTQARGFTALELLVTITVTGILVTMAVPSYTAVINRNRLRNIGEQLRSDLALARTEAIKRSRTVVVSFTEDDGAGGWCYGLNLDAGCDCTVTDVSDADICALDEDADGDPIRRVVSSDEHPGIALSSSSYANLSFSSVRPTVTSGSVTFASDSNQEVRISVSIMGRLRLCSPAGDTHLIYFEECPS